jgi:hypothetical protein
VAVIQTTLKLCSERLEAQYCQPPPLWSIRRLRERNHPLRPRCSGTSRVWAQAGLVQTCSLHVASCLAIDIFNWRCSQLTEVKRLISIAGCLLIHRWYLDILKISKHISLLMEVGFIPRALYLVYVMVYSSLSLLSIESARPQ